MTQNLDMIRLFRAELNLCKVTPQETLVVLTEGDDKHDYAEAFLAAGAEIGATSFQLNLTKRAARPGDRTDVLAGDPAVTRSTGGTAAQVQPGQVAQVGTPGNLAARTALACRSLSAHQARAASSTARTAIARPAAEL